LVLLRHQKHHENGDGLTDSDGSGKILFYDAISNTLKMGTESQTTVAWKNLVLQSHQQQPKDGDGVTDFDGLEKLGFTKPSATP
jgi:hypothetical protein